MRYELVTLGETMLRLTPPQRRRFDQTESFELYFGGSESNTAVGLARLGRRVAWLSRLPDHRLGRRLAAAIAGHGVSIDHVIWAPAEERLGLYYLEEGARPRSAQVIYDRRSSAMSSIAPAMLPADLFTGTNGHLHLTGITPALSTSAAATADAAARAAKAAGWRLSFDVNHRAKLWNYADARRGCATFIELCDLLIAPLRDARAFFALAESATEEDALADLAARFPEKTVVLTLGAAGAAGIHAGQLVRQPAFAVEAISRIGAGDAFAAGLLHAYLQDATDLARALCWGAAAAALKLTIPGDMPLFTQAEVAQLAAGHHPQDVMR